jgi:hypothetical protein
MIFNNQRRKLWKFLWKFFSDDNIFEEVTSIERGVLSASTSTTNAIQDLHQALAEDHNKNFQPPRSDNKKRFKTVSEEELRELQERKQSISTKKTKWGVRLFQGDLSYKKIYPTYFNPS